MQHSGVKSIGCNGDCGRRSWKLSREISEKRKEEAWNERANLGNFTLQRPKNDLPRQLFLSKIYNKWTHSNIPFVINQPHTCTTNSVVNWLYTKLPKIRIFLIREVLFLLLLNISCLDNIIYLFLEINDQ